VAVVHLVDGLDQGAHLHGGGIGIAARGEVVPGIVLVEHALEAEHHVVGVEIASGLEVVGGVKFHPLAQGEGVLQAIGGDLPAFGQARLQLSSALLEFHQAVVQRGGRGVEGIAGGVATRIEAFRIGLGADHQGACQGGIGRQAEEGGERQRE